MKDSGYLDWIRKQRCTTCQKTPPSDAHHLESGKMGGKCSDLYAIPLCRTCHQELHTTSLATFERRWQVKHSLYREAIKHRERYLRNPA